MHDGALVVTARIRRPSHSGTGWTGSEAMAYTRAHGRTPYPALVPACVAERRSR